MSGGGNGHVEDLDIGDALVRHKSGKWKQPRGPGKWKRILKGFAVPTVALAAIGAAIKIGVALAQVSDMAPKVEAHEVEIAKLHKDDERAVAILERLEKKVDLLVAAKVSEPKK